jgi:hypothetical protein
MLINASRSVRLITKRHDGRDAFNIPCLIFLRKVVRQRPEILAQSSKDKYSVSLMLKC